MKEKIVQLNNELELCDNLDKKETIEKEIKYNKKLIYVRQEYIVNLKYFFDLCNIKYIQAEGEADNICSKLNEKGIVDMVLSDDMDLLVSGTKIYYLENIIIITIIFINTI